MIDFANLTDEQKAFFNDLWESHQRQNEQSTESVKDFNAYLQRRRKHEDEQAQAAKHLKNLMR